MHKLVELTALLLIEYYEKGGLLLPMLPLEATAISSADFTSVLTALQGQISVSTVVEVLAVVVAACVGLAFMWWGVRKVIRALMSAFKKGKVSV